MNSTIFKVSLITVAVVCCLYALLCVILYFNQEKLIFYPQRLPKNHTFNFSGEYQEMYFPTKDGKTLNGVLFKAKESKGLIFYLHGNAGNIDSWGSIATTYTNLGYDVCLLDYRGYGKSTGKITSQNQLFEDNQLVYDEMKMRYQQDKITIVGYSIGTGMAAKLAADNNPKKLILQAPYYNLTDLMKKMFPLIPTFILNYKLDTNHYLTNCKMPIFLFHGNKDQLINYKASQRLHDEYKTNTELILLTNQGHNGITDNPHYQSEIKRILTL